MVAVGAGAGVDVSVGAGARVAVSVGDDVGVSIDKAVAVAVAAAVGVSLTNASIGAGNAVAATGAFVAAGFCKAPVEHPAKVSVNARIRMQRKISSLSSTDVISQPVSNARNCP